MSVLVDIVSGTRDPILLSVFAEDGDADVKKAVLKNTATSKETVKRLINDENAKVSQMAKQILSDC